MDQPLASPPESSEPGCVLVTGGAGYIGSHAVKHLLSRGKRVVILDDLSGGHREAVERLRALAPDRLTFIEGPVNNRGLIEGALRDHDVKAVLHFAALIAVGESVRLPLKYYRTNVAGTLVLLEAMRSAGTPALVYSSTAAVYADPPEARPLRESDALGPISPYGASKAAAERLIADFARAQAAQGRPFAHAVLRYFNVAGADRAGLLGEHHEPETHLVPLLLRAAQGSGGPITIFGDDYPSPPTPDGTPVRDYVHVDDLAEAHLRVLDALKPGDARTYNVGGGQGHSVKQVLASVERVLGKPVPTHLGPRREGDSAYLVADPSRLRNDLGWAPPASNLDEIVHTAWSWMQAHPRGYSKVKSRAKAF